MPCHKHLLPHQIPCHTPPPTPNTLPQEYWGYITTCGTEGNLHGILVGRENLPDGILYASSESHYSVFKAARMYRMDAIKVGV